MGSKGRMPPQQHLRRPHPPNPAMIHQEQVGPTIQHHALPPGPFNLMPPPQVVEQKLASQHGEMQRLATENQRLAATHSVLRQELAGAQQELQMLHTHIGSIKADREQQIGGLVEKIAKMEAELKKAEPLKTELQKARGEAQSLVVVREELLSKAQHLSQEIQRVHVDVQQIPALISELECLRQEFQHCRATYDYEKNIYNDHLKSLQVMEQNYVSMSKEVEKLRAELTKTTNVDRRSSGPYGGTSGTNANEASGLPVGQNAFQDGYAVAQGRGSLPAAAASAGGGSATTTTPAGAQPNQASAGTGYEVPRGGPGYIPSAAPTYDQQKGSTYDPQRVTGYDAFRGSSYDPKRGEMFDAQRNGYNPQGGSGYEVQRGPAYDASRPAAGYDAQARGVAAGPQGHVPPVNNMPYGSTTPPTRNVSGGGYDAARGVNPATRR